MDLTKPQIIELANRSVAYTLFDAQWVPSAARFVTLGNHARGTGAIEVCRLEGGGARLRCARRRGLSRALQAR